MENLYNTHISVHKLFEEQVQLTPDKFAIVDENLSLTYRQLDDKSNQLANYLISEDKLFDKPVAICLNRSANSLISILGVLKAGGAFMPLDPHSPEQRLQTILKNSNAKVIISGEKFKKNFSSYKDKLILLDSDNGLINKSSINNPDLSISPDNLAYIIHTSGSTGVPKGIATEHEPLANLILWHKNVLQDGSLKTLGFMPLTFDASIQEFFTTCCAGGTYYVTSDSLRLAPDKLVAFVVEKNIERMFMTFTPLQHFIKAVEDKKLHLPCLKSIINVGEPLIITRLFRNFFLRHPDCELHNQYGLTETAVDMTDYKFEGSPNDWPERPSAGHPITNAKIYILDEKLNPVKENEQGEIYVGGMSLAREFVNQPELTKEKFIPDPFSNTSDSRMYQTGDLGRWLDDGSFQCLGRKDSQVKIRGFRVELGEIQTVLLQHSSIKEAVTMLFDIEAGEKQLVAYLVCNPGKASGIFELRSYLEARLPDYMIPHRFVFLESLPVTKHGKLDRKALPVPGTPNSETRYEPPVKEVEKSLVTIWQQVLKIDKVGINDNFFIMGGDSILAAQILIQTEDLYNIDIALSTLYEKPTIAELGTIINNKIEERKQQEQLQLNSLLDQIEKMSDEEIELMLNDKR